MPVYLRRRAYYAMIQEKDETFSQFSYRKRAEARSAEINSMTDSDRLIRELLRSMRKGPLFTKFCEKPDLTLEDMNEIAHSHELATKLTAEGNTPQPATV